MGIRPPVKLHRTGLLIIATAALGLSAPAAQADTQYGGHGLYKGTRPANPSISLLRHDDGRVTGRVVLGARCRGYAGYSLVVRLSGRTADGVNFTADGRTKFGRGFVRATLTGTLAPDAANGSARVQTKGCGSYRNPFSLRVASAPAGAAAIPAPGTLLFGLTSQTAGGMGLPVTVRVTKNGRVAVSSQALLRCLGRKLPVLDYTPTRAIRADGTFGGTDRYTARYKGFSERYTVKVHGRFLADGVTGTITVTMRYRQANRRFPLCRSGQQTWSART
jgi:hypothetical protein